MLRLLAFASLLIVSPSLLLAQDRSRHFSQCQAIAQGLPGARYAAYHGEGLPVLNAELTDQTVRITFLGHSTFHIVTPEGVTIATDYSGWHRPDAPPMVATMNHAHSTHFTLTPEPEIDYVLHGWSDTPGEKARHEVMVRDTFIRNVTTDIRRYGGEEKDGNSIFVFEVAGLCIGHLGHLHHELSEGHYTEIGRLDVVMVPVDGGLTMGADKMSRVVKRLRSSLVLPMHRRGPPIETFLAMFGPDFEIRFAEGRGVDVSLSSLPKKPTILVLQGL
ncbi:MBL fold metallo-hydrolase [Rhizobium sp. FKL33]|uniref:MBL fold metallo-hydrolase n=1 Tax=Rhizobium sp. FKL33 TaxID=2562307 RepID=UPI001FF03F5D|nr:MBL fold metallo-hydrolase [Rhizobium sp. FKL33]